MTKRVLGATLALALILTLAACGSTGSAGGTTTAPTTSGSISPAATSDHNTVDVIFTSMMIPHHEGAIEMSDLALTNASDQQVKDLAGRIKAAQGPEIDQMRGWLAEWGTAMPMATAGTGIGHGMMSTASSIADDYGMGDMMNMSEADMAALRAASGVDFDKLFLQQMIAHHQGAIEMGEVEIAHGQNADALALARAIKTSQAAEITEMQQLLSTR